MDVTILSGLDVASPRIQTSLSPTFTRLHFLSQLFVSASIHLLLFPRTNPDSTMPPPSGRSSRRSSSHSRTNSMSSVGRRNSNFGGPRLGMTSAAPQDDLTHSAQNHDVSLNSSPSDRSLVRPRSDRSGSPHLVPSLTTGIKKAKTEGLLPLNTYRPQLNQSRGSRPIDPRPIFLASAHSNALSAPLPSSNLPLLLMVITEGWN